jgi:hypothetical protein
MPTNRAYIRRPRRSSQLTWDKELDLWLGAGPRHNLTPFATLEARRAAWEKHRDRFIGKLPSSPGKRPAAWWDYDAPPGLRRPHGGCEASILWQAGLLVGEEKAALEAEWRREFERAQTKGFMLCEGPGKVLTGPAARRAHYVWADIPTELIKRWTVAHRQAAKTVRGLLGQAQ